MTTEPKPADLPRPLDLAWSLDLATRNAAGLWTALAETRGYALTRRPGLLTVDRGERTGPRILLLSPDPDPDELAELTALIRRRPALARVVEDPYSTLDLTELGLTSRQLPVMIREHGAAVPASTLEVTLVSRPDQLATVEDVVVHGFPLPDFQPYRHREAFPESLLARDDVEFFLVTRDGEVAGACLTVLDGTVGGIYWVTTLPEHRSRGVGRQLMHAVLARLNDRPITLTAAKAGKPLYDSLGFRTITQSTWWA